MSEIRDGVRVVEPSMNDKTRIHSDVGSSEAEEVPAGPERCLYCGYSLRGLPEASACPECGMRSVPQAMRQAVWDLVDSPGRLWFDMLSLWQKHPPGWWWSLDRRGDLRRGVGMLFRNLIVVLVILIVTVGAAASTIRITTDVFTWYERSDIAGTTPVGSAGLSHAEGMLGTWLTLDVAENGAAYEAYRQAGDAGYRLAMTARSRVAFRIAWHTVPPVLVAFAWLACLWLSVSLIGLWTQIRRGLPSFAKPPRTIIAASCLESCKLVYLSVIVGMAAGAECALRLSLLPGRGSLYANALIVLISFLIAVGAASWIGPLRSDFTRQLIRSRVHLVRILLMYAVAMPFALMILCVVVVALTIELLFYI